MWRNSLSVFNILQYILLLVVAALSLTSPLAPERWQWWATAVLLIGLSFLYWRWPVRRHALYLATELLVLAALVVLSPNTVLLGFAFAAHAMILFPSRTGALSIVLWAVLAGVMLIWHEGWLAGLLDALLISAGASAFGYAQFSLGQARSAQRQSESLLEDLEAANEQLRRYAGQVEELTLAQERQRLAREIHDTLAQGFASIVMHLEALEATLPEKDSPVQPYLDQARRTARESLDQARRLVWALRPEILEDTSLANAVKRVVSRWEEESGVACDTAITGTVRPLHPEVEITLLRALQEALANVRKHAGAKGATATLSYMDDLVALDVQDDGDGFDPSALKAFGAGGGFGLTSMRERVEQLGGTLIVESALGEGTTLAVEVPLVPRATDLAPGTSPGVEEVRLEL